MGGMKANKVAFCTEHTFNQTCVYVGCWDACGMWFWFQPRHLSTMIMYRGIQKPNLTEQAGPTELCTDIGGDVIIENKMC